MKPRNKTTDKLNALSALAGADTNIDPTPEEVKRDMATFLNTGELNLGFCKLTKKKIKGSRGKSHGTEFKRKSFYKIGVKMGEEIKRLLSN